MNDAFAQLVTPILRHGTDLQRRIGEQGEDPDPASVKAELLELIAGSESRAAASRDLAADFALAKHALVYWLDEILIESRWSRAADWKHSILEWDYFRERVGGGKFYEMAQEAERRPRVDPLETFFLCVALGFRGVPEVDDGDHHGRLDLDLDHGGGRTRVLADGRRVLIEAWVERAYARIVGDAPAAERFLPDEPRDPALGGLKPLPGKTVLLTVSVLVAITWVVTLAGFLLAAHLAD